MRNPIRVQEVTDLPAHDPDRWQQNEHGDWIRIIGNSGEAGVQATTGAIETAEELGIDLTTVIGTGKDGKVTKADVEALVSD